MNSSQGWVTCPGCSLGEFGMKTQLRKQKPKEKLYLELNFAEKPLVRFEADILAAEDFACIHRSRPLSPERELMAAVLEEALADYQRCWKARDKKAMERFADAQAWILELDSEWIFSFVNCCEALGIQPDYLRQGLLRSNQGKSTRSSSASAIKRGRNQPKRLRQAA
jgi:hypothetical protein